jgi:hypothetical protein
MPFKRLDGKKSAVKRKLTLGKKYCDRGIHVGNKKAIAKKKKDAKKLAAGAALEAKEDARVRRKRYKKDKRDKSSHQHEQLSPPSSP